MYEWQSFCNKYQTEMNVASDFSKITTSEVLSLYEVYPDSINKFENSTLLMANNGILKNLIVIGESSIYYEFFGEEVIIGNTKIKLSPINHLNCEIIRREFKFTAPIPVLNFDKTIGLGDRLGLATPGHIKLIKKYNVKPVFAQQSIRELGLTDRTYEDVLDDASWAVFQEGYKKGFGADGDHLKKPEEIDMALKCGFTMITLDCSEHIDNTINALTDAEVDKLYSKYSFKEKDQWEYRYALRKFFLKDTSYIEFPLNDYKKIILTYSKAIKFAIKIYNEHIKGFAREVNFEVSIDETLTPTSFPAHFLFASELIGAGVNVATMAPRFCGEFQKGIDYIGNVNQFEEEFKVHVKIASFFGYKISVHSGSDKFSVFPIIGKETKGKYHVKTAGTNWLEAIRVLTEKEPALYREIHTFALNVLDEAKKYYHIGADTRNIPDVNTLGDDLLPDLMNKADSRQVIHITYGLILLAKKPDGSFLFRDRIYDALLKYENEYSQALYKHIGRHLTELGEKVKNE